VRVKKDSAASTEPPSWTKASRHGPRGAGDGVPVQRHKVSDMPHGIPTRHTEDVHLLDKNHI
jgi:hypothetical protein